MLLDHHSTPQDLSYKLEREIYYLGGFSQFIPRSGPWKKYAFIFPSTKLVSVKERESYVRQFIAVLYNVSGGGEQCEQGIDMILTKLAPDKLEKKCDKPHVKDYCQAKNVFCQAVNVSQNVNSLPPSTTVFRSPDPNISPSTPGPRVSKVADLDTPHTPEDSLRILNHLQLSDYQCRYIRKISLIGLSSEYAVKQLRQKLLGNEGKGFVEAEKWYRDLNQEIKHYENGAPKMLDVVLGRIPSDNIVTAVQH